MGRIITIAGTGEATGSTAGDGGPAVLSEIGLPEDVAAGPDGRVYFADLVRNRIGVLTRQPF